MPTTQVKFNPLDYLDSHEAKQAYLDEAVSTGDLSFICESIGVLAKQHGIKDIAKKTGLVRESLYKTMGSKGNPKLSTLILILNVLGLTMTIGNYLPNDK
nr:addiction module antidote protein [Vibrio splendidus]MCC4882476.1 putative addiction module antidote protein [Vibrio splendidus]